MGLWEPGVKALGMLAAPIRHMGMKEILMFLNWPDLDLYPGMVLPSPTPMLIWAQFSRVQVAQKVKAKGPKRAPLFLSSLGQHQ